MTRTQVAKLPDRQVVVFLLLEGGTFQDYIEGRAILRETLKVTVPLTRKQIEAGVEHIDPTPHTPPRPAYPSAQWVPGWALLDCATFTTPSQDLSPDAVCIDGSDIYYIDDAGLFRKERVADVVITRDGKGGIERVNKRVPA